MMTEINSLCNDDLMRSGDDETLNMSNIDMKKQADINDFNSTDNGEMNALVTQFLKIDTVLMGDLLNKMAYIIDIIKIDNRGRRQDTRILHD